MAISTLYPSSRPSLSLDFAKSKRLDPRITFTRAQTGNTSSYIDSNGLIRYAGPDEPRFDHNPTTGESLGLLIEESRFNKTTYSDYSTVGLSDVAKSTTVSTLAPDGSSVFAFEANNNTSVTHRINLGNGSTGSATSAHTASFFMKIPPIGPDQISSSEIIRITVRWRSSSGSGTGAGITYNQSTQQYDIYTGVNAFGANAPTTYNVSQAYIVDYPNGWKRFVFPNAVASTDPNDSFGNYDWNISETGNEFGGNCTVFLWGAQFEQNTFVTSYIPTSGSGINRPGDAVTMEVGPEDNKLSIQDFNSNGEGTLLCEFTDSDGVGSNIATAFSAGTHNGTSFLGIGSNSNFEPFIRNRVNTTNQALLSESSLDTSAGFVKVGFIIDQDFNKIVTSSGVLEDTSVSYDTDPYNKLIIGRDQITTDNNRIFGTIKKITFYPSSLSVSNLQTLTK